jgi:CBS domain containing-hemolysin-like protein
MSTALEIWIVLVSTSLNAFFSGVETAVISARSVSIAHRARSGEGSARFAQAMVGRREAVIVTSVLGNNLALVAGSAAATALCVELYGLRGEWIAAVVMTFLSVVFGEVLPKAALRAQPERGLVLAAPLFILLEWLLWPLRWLVVGASQLVLGLFGLRAKAGVEQLSRDIVRSNLERSLRHGSEERLLKRFLDNIARPIREIATPLHAASCLGPQDTVAGAIERVRDSHHSRLPLLDAQGRLDGLVLFRDLLDADPKSLAREVGREILQLPQSMGLDEAIVALTGHNASLAGVLDEAERPVGILTLEDLLAALLGDFQPESALPEGLLQGEI